MAPPQKTHCNYGHAMTPENTTVVRFNGGKYYHRQCRMCFDFTSADVARAEAYLAEGGVLNSFAKTLPFARRMGLEAYRVANPEWSAKIEALSKASYSRSVSARLLEKRLQRTHCLAGHALTPENLDRDLVALSASWNFRACLTCRAEADALFRVDEVKITKDDLRQVKVERPSVGKLHRRQCKHGHALRPDNIVVTITCRSPSNPNGYKHHQCKLCVEFSDADAAFIMDQVDRGIPIKRMQLPPRKDRNSLVRYREEHPNWDTIFTAKIRANSLAARIAGSKRVFGGATHCRQGHEFTAENTYWFGKTRSCKICHLKRQKEGKAILPSQIEQSKTALLTGMSVEGIIRGETKIMSSSQWRTLRRTNPEYNRWVLENVQNERSFIGLQRRGSIAPLTGIVRKTIERVSSDPTIPVYVPRDGDMAYFYNLTPGWLSVQDRWDIVSNIFVALQERRLRPEDVCAKMREFTKDQTEMFAFKAYGNLNAPLSLNEPITFEKKMQRVEEISSRDAMYGEDSIYR